MNLWLVVDFMLIQMRALVLYYGLKRNLRMNLFFYYSCHDINS